MSLRHCVLIVLSSFIALSAFAEQNVPVRAGKGKAFNPDVSTNFLGLWRRGTGFSNDRFSSDRNGFSLQEAELQLFSDVDPYLRAVALFSISQEDGKTSFGIDPEEVYVETISIPAVTFRAGKFKMALGRHNQLHTHAFPFIDQPLINTRLFGAEGLNEAGVSASILVPTSWYTELILQAFGTNNDTLYGNQTVNGVTTQGALESGQTGVLVHLKNLWDLSEDLTAELGVSGTTAKNQFARTTSVGEGDLTFKWRPAVGGKYHAWIWSTEYFDGNRVGFYDANGNSTARLGGMASWVQYQFAERWWVQGRYEFVGAPRTPIEPIEHKQSALIGFFPSEFSGFRAQYDHVNNGPRGKADHALSLQYNITIGAHPAHAY